MGIVDEKFRKVRQDQTPYLFHFMRGTADEAKAILDNILKEERLISSKGYICFTASPVTALMDFFKTKKSTDGLPCTNRMVLAFHVICSLKTMEQETLFIPRKMKSLLYHKKCNGEH